MKTAPISVTLINSCGTDLDVVNAARVSFHKESSFSEFYACGADKEDGIFSYKLEEKDTKLINYLAKHEHKSPLPAAMQKLSSLLQFTKEQVNESI